MAQKCTVEGDDQIPSVALRKGLRIGVGGRWQSRVSRPSRTTDLMSRVSLRPTAVRGMGCHRPRVTLSR